MLKKRLTEQELLKKVDDRNIFTRYFGPFEIRKAYKSVFDKEENPSTGFFINDEGRIVYNDFRTGEALGSVAFVCKLYGLSYFKALEKIAKDFGVIPGKDGITKVAPIKIYRPEVKKEKVYTVKVDRKWTEEEVKYWMQFFITPEELKENMVFACREVQIDGRVLPNHNNELRFLYKVVDLNRDEYIKIYAPYSEKFKWMGNCPFHIPFGLMELPFKSDTLIITKGQKDRIIWKKFFTDVIALQNESPNSLTDEIGQLLQKNYKNVYINFDVDKQWIKNKETQEFEWRYLGKEATTYYCEKYGWKHINVPNEYYDRYGIKDFADLVKNKDLNTFRKYLQWKKLI